MATVRHVTIWLGGCRGAGRLRSILSSLACNAGRKPVTGAACRSCPRPPSDGYCLDLQVLREAVQLAAACLRARCTRPLARGAGRRAQAARNLDHGPLHHRPKGILRSRPPGNPGDRSRRPFHLGHLGFGLQRRLRPHQRTLEHGTARARACRSPARSAATSRSTRAPPDSGAVCICETPAGVRRSSSNRRIIRSRSSSVTASRSNA